MHKLFYLKYTYYMKKIIFQTKRTCNIMLDKIIQLQGPASWYALIFFLSNSIIQVPMCCLMHRFRSLTTENMLMYLYSFLCKHATAICIRRLYTYVLYLLHSVVVLVFCQPPACFSRHIFKRASVEGSMANHDKLLNKCYSSEFGSLF